MSVEPDSGSAPVIALGPSVPPGSTGDVVACSPASSSTAPVVPGGDEQRILVRVAAVFGQETVTTDFRTSSSTALSKLLLFWCSKHGCAPGEVRLSLADGSEPVGEALPLETRIAELQAQAFGTNTAAVTLQATPEPGAEKRWPSSASSAVSPHGGGICLVGAQGAAALGTAALRAAQLLSVRVVAECEASKGHIRVQGDDETQFWVPPELPMSTLMGEWCAHHRIEQPDVRFFLDGRELLPTDTLHQWGFKATEGSGSAGRAAIQISAEPSSLEAANRSPPPQTPLSSPTSEDRISRASSSEPVIKREPGQAPRVQIRTEAVGALATRLQGLSQKHAAGGMKCYMKMGAPLLKLMDLWCEDHGLKRQAVTFRLGSGYAIQPEDTAEKMGCQEGQQVTFYVELRPASAPPDRRVVVTVSDGNKPGEEGLDFKMLPETSFERLMNKWCELHQKTLKDVAFLLEDGSAALRPHDSPLGVCPQLLGCNSSTLRIRVESVQQSPASESPSRQSRQMTESLAAAGDTANGPAQPASDGRVVVTIDAEAAGVKQKLKFRMGSTVSFEKVIALWCKSHTELQPSEAVRLSMGGGGRVLSLQDTPQSCNWRPEDGTLNISAVLINHNSQESSSKREAAAAAEAHQKPAEAAQALAASAPREAASGSSYTSALAAASASAASAAAAPSQQASAAAPPHAPAAGTPAASASASSSASQPSAASALPASGTGDKVLVEVLAELAEEPSLTQFPMKCTTEFEKMMKAWSSKHGQQLDDVVFWTACPDSAGVESRREVLPHECPSALGWSAAHGVLTIQVTQRLKKEGTPSDHAVEPAATDAKTNGQTKIANAASSTIAKKAGDDDKIKVQVVALGPDGEVKDDYTMRVTTPFEKMMRAWSKQNEIDVDEARFEFNGRVLRPDETPAHFEWSPEKGVLVIKATPAEDEDDDAEGEGAGQDATGMQVREATAIKPEATPALAPMKESAPAPAPASAPALTPTSTSGSSSGNAISKDDSLGAADNKGSNAVESSAATEAAPPIEKVMVKVVAEGEIAEGENNSTELNFKMKSSTPFEKMMWKWCETFRIPPAEVCFTILHGRELKAEDTPDSCNWSPDKGTLIVNAIPRESASDDIASAATPARVSESTPSGQESEAARPVSTGSGDSAEPATLVSASAAPAVSPVCPETASAAPSNSPRASAALDASSTSPSAAPAAASTSAPVAPSASGNEALAASSIEAPAAPAASSSTSAPETATAHAPATNLSPPVAIPAAAAGADMPNERPPVAIPVATAGNPSAVAPEKVSIKVIAQCEEGDNVIDVKMKPSSPFEKMMKAWCKQTGLSLDEVQFFRDGKLLRLQDTPDSLGYKPEDGDLVIHAQPREDNACEDQQDGENVRVTVTAASAGGEVAKVDMKMKSHSPFREMMQAWCDHQGLALDAVLFELRGLPLKPEDSPSSRGWTAAQGDIEVNAIPQKDELKESSKTRPSPAVPSSQSRAPSPKADAAAAAAASSPGRRAAPNRPAPAAKVQVQVVASGPQGQNIVNVNMKATTCFKKMMDAWCKNNGISQDSVMFLLEDGRELKHTDSPQSCGAQGSLKISAVGKASAAPAATGEAVEAPPAAARETEPRTTETAASASAAAPPNTPAEQAVPVEDVKVEIAVHAEGEDGSFVQNVRMKAGSPFSKVMAAFCKEVGIPVEEACFCYGSRELKQEDTPYGVGWRPGGGVLDVHARPRDEPMATSDAAPSEASALKTEAAASSTPAEATGEAGASGTSPCEAAKDQEKIAVRIVAMAADGEVTLEYQLASSAEFGTIMREWYEHHRLVSGSARFLLDGSLIREGDTPASLGRGSSQGPLRVVAEPRGDEEESKAAVPAASASNAPGAAKPPAPPAAEAGDSAAANVAAEPAGAVEVKVVADGSDGRNVLTFKMKLSTSFGKMMSKWCEHHGIQQDLAAFFHGTREIHAEDTPQVLGWSPTQPGDSVTIQAMPRAAVASGNRSKEKGKKRKNVQGEEPAPKRAKGAYQFFAQSRRPALVEERPELKNKMTEQTKALSSEWREMSEEARRPYEEEAARDRQRAEAERAAYAARQPASASGLAPEDAEPSQPSVAEQLADDAGIAMLVVAEGEDGLCEDRFKLKMCTPLEKMMSAWCNSHEIPEDDATFALGIYNGTDKAQVQIQFALRRADTTAELRRRFGAKVLANAGLTGEDTALMVKAVPNEGQEFEEALKARENMEAKAAAGSSSASTTAAITTPASSSSTSAAGPAPRSPPVPPKAAPKPPRALKRQRSDTSAARGGSNTLTASRLRRSRGSTRGAAAEDEEKASSDCSASASGGEEKRQKLRRSARLREAQPMVSATATIIHKPPPFSQKRPRKEAAEAEAAASPESKVEPDSQYMSFEEYLKYDKEQGKLVAKAREERQKRMLVSGVDDEDEEYQLAMALSISMAQGTAAEAPPAAAEAPAAAAAEAGAAAASGEASAAASAAALAETGAAAPASEPDEPGHDPECQKRMEVSGAEDEDEEYQMAVALSKSMAQGTAAEAPPAAPAEGGAAAASAASSSASGEAPAAAASVVASAEVSAAAPAEEQLERGSG